MFGNFFKRKALNKGKERIGFFEGFEGSKGVIEGKNSYRMKYFWIDDTGQTVHETTLESYSAEEAQYFADKKEFAVKTYGNKGAVYEKPFENRDVTILKKMQYNPKGYWSENNGFKSAEEYQVVQEMIAAEKAVETCESDEKSNKKPKQFCSFCGEKVDGVGKFCSSCGEKVE